LHFSGAPVGFGHLPQFAEHPPFLCAKIVPDHADFANESEVEKRANFELNE
jgi:hypothetical protein